MAASDNVGLGVLTTSVIFYLCIEIRLISCV